MDTIRNLKIMAAGTVVLLAAAAGLTIPSVLSPLVAGTTGGETGRDAARLEAAYESPDPGPQLAPAGTEENGGEPEASPEPEPPEELPETAEPENAGPDGDMAGAQEDGEFQAAPQEPEESTAGWMEDRIARVSDQVADEDLEDFRRIMGKLDLGYVQSLADAGLDEARTEELKSYLLRKLTYEEYQRSKELFGAYSHLLFAS